MFARDQIQWRVPVQGNLDPLVLVAGGEPGIEPRPANPVRGLRGVLVAASSVLKQPPLLCQVLGARIFWTPVSPGRLSGEWRDDDFKEVSGASRLPSAVTS